MIVNNLNKIFKLAGCLALAVVAASCGDETVPKPKAYLRLDYPVGEYRNLDVGCPFTFDVNTSAEIKDKDDCSIELHYPKMKATVYLNYKPVNGNLERHLRDAQTLTYKHTVRADEIQERPYNNAMNRVYGMFYQVGGNAATNAQFYVTDSTKHFLTGSVYFYAKPNFDSIMPAASFIKDDMQNIVESLRWK